jgi:hypothetical protein
VGRLLILAAYQGKYGPVIKTVRDYLTLLEELHVIVRRRINNTELGLPPQRGRVQQVRLLQPNAQVVLEHGLFIVQPQQT